MRAVKRRERNMAPVWLDILSDIYSKQFLWMKFYSKRGFYQ